MTIDLLSLLKKSKIFSSLNDDTLKKIIGGTKKVYLRAGKRLFNQSDLPDGMYLLVSGRLLVIYKKDTNEKIILGEVYPGETVGELSSLSFEPRSATVKSGMDSILLKISSDTFKEICNEHPQVLTNTLHILVNRSYNLITALSDAEPEKRHIAILPANKKVSLAEFAETISLHVGDMSGVKILSDLENDQDIETLKQQISEIDGKRETIIYLLSLHETALSQVCFENADMIYVVAIGDEKPYINRFTLDKIKKNKLAYNVKPELILLQDENIPRPKLTSRWLKLAKFSLHHHIRLNNNADCQRILRFMRGKAVGVVLGGGGVRSWAHLGAIKAILEAGIPIDIIGGTSAGAIVSAHYALYETYEDKHNDLKELSAITRKVTSFRNLTWPAISIFNGKAYTEKQRDMFDAVRIENLWLPFFCVSCNISQNIQVSHKRGYLWKAVRSSTAVPAIFPPVVVRGEVYLDGGILNNLPVDIMRKMVGSRGTIIAVELTHHNKDSEKYSFPPVLTFWHTMLAKFGMGIRKYRFPPFVDTFLKSLLAGSSVKQRENSAAASILISPDLSAYSMLTIGEKDEMKLMRLGYEAGVKAINKWNRKK